MCSACEIIVGLPEGIKVNVAQALLPVGLSRNGKSVLKRSDKTGE
jgi:hypothetical protein